MLHIILSSLLLLGIISGVSPGSEHMQDDLKQDADRFEWKLLCESSQSVQGAFWGIAGGKLILVGGFEENGFSSDAASNKVFVLGDNASTWIEAGLLSQPATDGFSAIWQDSFIIIGRSGRNADYRKVQLLKWNDDDHLIRVEILPDLPKDCNPAGADVIKDVLYVVGNSMWAMDLSRQPRQRKWERLGRLPEEAGEISGAVAQDGAIFVLDSDRRTFRFDPKRGWRRVADLFEESLPVAVSALGQSHLLAFGERISVYHTITDTWVSFNTRVEGFVPRKAVTWDGSIALLGSDSNTGRDVIYKLETSRRVSGLNGLDYLSVGVYFLILVVMGVFFSKRMKTTGDFFLAGRRVPWWVAGISIRATQISSIGFLAMPAKAYATNWAYFAGILTIPLVAPLIIRFYLPFFRRLDVTSAYEYLEKRFNVTVRLFGSVVFVVFQLARIGVVLFLPSLAISAVTGVDIYLCILAAGVLCTFYTVLGGIEAVMWTDLLQEIILFGGPLLCLILAVAGTDGGLWGYMSLGGADGKFQMADWNFDFSLPTIYVVLLGYSIINLNTYTSDQAVVQRYLTTKSDQEAVRAVWLNAAFAVPWGLLCFLLGTAFYTFYKTHPQLIEIGAESDKVLPLFVAQQLPIGMAGLILAALSAATMSTVDSGMHSTATVIVTDFFRRFGVFKSDRSYLKLARFVTVLLGLFGTGVALLMATYDIKSLWDLFIGACALLGSGLGGLFALGIFTRRANGIGALTGAAASSLILYLVKQYTDIHFFLYAAVGFASCFLVGYLCSCLLPVAGQNLAGLTMFDLAPRED